MLLPFVSDIYPEGHKLMADNDPKHTSRCAKNFIAERGINWWRTPAESPDLNPIENLWHELKECIRREVKPRTKEQLIDGIEAFWTTVSLDKCRKYIRHLRKVIP
jgi:transposase